jgi:hypothetical protein
MASTLSFKTLQELLLARTIFVDYMHGITFDKNLQLLRCIHPVLTSFMMG